MSEQEELKPCPFCGAVADISWTDQKHKFFECYEEQVQCSNEECEVKTALCKFKGEAVRKWNRRAGEKLS